MKTKSFTSRFFILLTLFLFQNIFAQSNYFPLHVGDKFKYKITQINNPGSTTYSYTGYTVTSTMVGINGNVYFYCPGFPAFPNKWLRIDAATSNLFYYDSSGTGFCYARYQREEIVDSLAMISGIFENCNHLETHVIVSQSTMFGISTNIRTFNKQIGSVSGLEWIKSYSDKFGMKKYTLREFGPLYNNSITYDLLGCYINGEVYGDTSLAGVGIINSETPVNYSLSQNYPNPFNPSTKINYEVKSSGFVSLKVFDLLGKEVAALVNEKQNAGGYQVDFNSTEFNLPSGIYFYTLNAGEFNETKKMVLVK